MTPTRFFYWLPGLVAALTLAGCGGSSGGTTATAPPDAQAPPPDSSVCTDDCGTVMVGMTDADGDFLQYAVEVTSLSLTRADGVKIETMPAAAAVDFAQYTELTEFLTTATVPRGTYVAAEITLNYADASTSVERDGAAVDAHLLDTDGLPLTIETLELQLADSHRLVVLPGAASILIVDFDLAASHEVDLSTTPAIVTASPFIVADVDPIESRTMRLRGPLISVNPDDSRYVTAVRPFWRWNGDFGRAQVQTTADTAFEIDDVSYAGDDGIRAMANLTAGTATLAFGTLDVAVREFTAHEVYAGSSVPGHSADIVRGVIAARTGDVIELRGVTVIRERGTVAFRGAVDVLVGPQTVVRKSGDPDFDGGNPALSVGQRVNVFGRIVDENPDELMLDATGGKIRMLRTIVTGTTNDITDGQIDIALQEVAGRNVSLFDFAGTGMPGQDALPGNYEVASGDLDTRGLTIGSPVKVSGFVSPFGLAPPDFVASTIADFSEVRSQLFIGWDPATDSPYLTIGPEGLVVDLENPDIGLRHYVVRGGIVTDLLTLPGATILPRTDRPGLYGIQQRGLIRLYTDFGIYTRDLANLLGSGQTLRSVYANGVWSDIDTEIEASRILTRIN